MNRPNIESNYIPEKEVPTRKLAATFWTELFHKIPEGKALVVKGKDGLRCYEAMRKFKSRMKDDWVEYEGRKMGDTIYIIHYSKESLNNAKKEV
jgi:hypothetical protein